MLNIDNLKKSGYFKKISLKSGDMLFDEGDKDNNLYYIESGKISIEKYTSKERKETKKLAILSEEDFFGEGALSNSLPKKVSITCLVDSVLFSIDAEKGVEELIKNYPIDGLNLLKHLIKLTNHRLLESNAIITATYEINKHILSLGKITIKSIIEIINNIQSIINSDYILYFEQYEAIDTSLILKYNTKKGMKILSELVDIKNNQLTFKDISNHKDNYNYIQKLSLGEINLGYLVFCNKNKDFSENDKKIILSIIPSISGIVRQKELHYEERNKDFMINS